MGDNAKEMWEQGRKIEEERSTSKFVSSAKLPLWELKLNYHRAQNMCRRELKGYPRCRTAGYESATGWKEGTHFPAPRSATCRGCAGSVTKAKQKVIGAQN